MCAIATLDGSAATYDGNLGGENYLWSDTGLDWAGATTVELALSAPLNNPATGTPSIAGTTTVDETLTAGPNDIADGDGLPSETFPDGYTFKWYRVDNDGAVLEQDAKSRVTTCQRLPR